MCWVLVSWRIDPACLLFCVCLRVRKFLPFGCAPPPPPPHTHTHTHTHTHIVWHNIGLVRPLHWSLTVKDITLYYFVVGVARIWFWVVETFRFQDFCYLTPCRLVKGYRRFGGTYFLHPHCQAGTWNSRYGVTFRKTCFLFTLLRRTSNLPRRNVRSLCILEFVCFSCSGRFHILLLHIIIIIIIIINIIISCLFRPFLGHHHGKLNSRDIHDTSVHDQNKL
jgi:hypothetical protein